MADDKLLTQVTQFYLESRDFNGIPVRNLLGGGDAGTLERLESLVHDGLVAIVYGDGHPNPHIRALPETHTADVQARMLTSSSLAEYACAYPLPKHLRQVVDCSKYAGEPYKLALALGCPQLSHRSFDMAVLESYRNDPRYHYVCDDIHGGISIKDEHYETGTTMERDQVLLQHFGFAYGEDLNKYVAVFLWDLFRLSPEHQRLWEAREIRIETKLHPDYFRTAILGDFPKHSSIYQAFIKELQIINDMARTMERPSLFRDTERPRDFASLLRPTAREFESFVLLLDKLMSDNISKAFFMGEVPDSEDVPRSDGKVEVRAIGTIRMLSDWISKKFRLKDPAPVQEMLATFREVRSKRQKPAHRVGEDTFNQQFIHDQRELMVKAYEAVRLLRLLFANHPATKVVKVPRWLHDGRIWFQ